MAKIPSTIVSRLEEVLKETVIEGSEHVLSLIIRLELEELAKEDPSFPELARTAKEVILAVEKAVEVDSTLFERFDYLRRLREYAEILDQIAAAVEGRNNELLIDTITHLQEFVEINGKK